MHNERFKTRLNSPNANILIRNFRSSFVGRFDLPFPRSPSVVIHSTTFSFSFSQNWLQAIPHSAQWRVREKNCVRLQILICVPFLSNYVWYLIRWCASISLYAFDYKPYNIVTHTHSLGPALRVNEAYDLNMNAMHAQHYAILHM